jgi:hypothetical protein
MSGRTLRRGGRIDRKDWTKQYKIRMIKRFDTTLCKGSS